MALAAFKTRRGESATRCRCGYQGVVDTLDHACPLSRVTFEVVSSVSGFNALEQEWNCLFDGHGDCNQLFQTYAWNRAWVRQFFEDDGPRGGARDPREGGTELRVLIARQDNQTLLIWPLVRVTRFGQTHVGWMGEPVSQYGDVLCVNDLRREALITAGLDLIRNTFGADLLNLRKVRAGTMLSRVLAREGAVASSHSAAPYVDLAKVGDFDKFQNRFPARMRKNRRRHRRRLEEQGRITFETLSDDAEMLQLTALALDYKRAWLMERGLPSRAFCDTRLDGFFADIVSARSTRCVPYVAVLRCEGHPVAINIGFRCNGRLAIHIACYDLAFERFSPGTLLFEECLRDSFAGELAIFDFLSPEDAYKKSWSSTAVPMADYSIALTTKGRVYDALYTRRVRPAVKYAADRLPRSSSVWLSPFSRYFISH